MKTVRFSEIVNSSGKPDTHLLLTAPAKDRTLQAGIKSNRVMTVYQGSGSTKSDYGIIGFAEGSSRQFLLFPKTLKSFVGKRVIGIKYDLLQSTADSKGEATAKPKTGKTAEPRRDQAPAEVDHRPAGPKGNLSDDVSDEAPSDNRTVATRLAASEASSDDRTVATRLAASEASSDVRTMANRGRRRNRADKPVGEQPDTPPKSLANVVLPKSAGTTTSKKKESVSPREKKSTRAALPEKVLEFPKPGSNEQRSDRSDEIEELKRRVRAVIAVLEQGKQVAAYNLLKRIVED